MKNSKTTFYALLVKFAIILLLISNKTYASKNLEAPVLTLDTEYVYVNQFRVSWDAVEGATHYKIWVKHWDADPDDYLPLYNGKIITSNFAWVFNLSPNNPYICHIRAYNDTEESPSSNIIQAETFPANIAAPVLEAATDITSDSFTISWSSIEGTQPVYNVLVSKDDFHTLVPGLPVFTESTSLVISGLEPYTNYKYKVNGQDFQGDNMSSFSETHNVTTVLPPPVALEATDVMHDRFTANWTSVVNTTGYNLWVVYNEQPLEGYWPLALSDTTHTITGLEPEETYHYLVTSVAGGHNSDFSDAIEVTTTDTSTSVNTVTETTIAIYPNPAQNQISIEGLEPNSTIDVFSINGAKVMRLNNQSGSVNLDVSGLGSGVYIIKINAANKSVSKRILINQ